MKNNNILKLEKLANKELKKICDYLKDNEKIWKNYTDLKLHDASYCDIDFEGYYGGKITFNDEVRNNWFNMFCEDSYNNFIEYLNENNIDFEKSIDRIGRTSSFYLGEYHNYKLVSDAVYELLDIDNNYSNLILNCSDNELTVERYTSDSINDNENEYINDLLELIDNVFNDFMEDFKPLEIIYNYLDDFKTNQVKYFREYVEETFRANF